MAMVDVEDTLVLVTADHAHTMSIGDSTLTDNLIPVMNFFDRWLHQQVPRHHRSHR